MSLQCQYVVGLHRDENPTKYRCRHNIAFPLKLHANRVCSVPENIRKYRGREQISPKPTLTFLLLLFMS